MEGSELLQRLIIRELNPTQSGEVEIVALRMRDTLIEVLGEEQGMQMYTLEWLKDRVLFHLDASRCVGSVFLAKLEGRIVGHCLLREESTESNNKIGLFSSTYVCPEFRRGGVAQLLHERGETWMREKNFQQAATYTDEKNHKLIQLYLKRGYVISHKFPQRKMIMLSKSL